MGVGLLKISVENKFPRKYVFQRNDIHKYPINLSVQNEASRLSELYFCIC